MFGRSLRILTVICAIKGPGVIRHMNTEAALTTAARQRIAQPSACNCHRSVVLFLWLWEMEVFEDGDKAGVVALSAAASLSGSIRKQGNPGTRHARQGPLEQPLPLFHCEWFTERFPWFASVCMICVIRHAVILRSWLSLLWRAWIQHFCMLGSGYPAGGRPPDSGNNPMEAFFPPGCVALNEITDKTTCANWVLLRFAVWQWCFCITRGNVRMVVSVCRHPGGLVHSLCVQGKEGLCRCTVHLSLCHWSQCAACVQCATRGSIRSKEKKKTHSSGMCRRIAAQSNHKGLC